MEHAAPPDDGGVRGSFTVPEDALVVTPDESTTPHDEPIGMWSLGVGVALVVLSLLLFGIYVPM